MSAAPVEREGHLLRQLDMRDVDLPEGADIAMTCAVTPRVTNPRGGLQGGLVATLIDIAAGRAALLGVPNDDSVATSDMNIHFLSAVTVGPARAVARVLRRGRNTVVVHVDVYDDGRDVLAAVATLSFAVVRLRAGQHDPGRERLAGDEAVDEELASA